MVRTFAMWWCLGLLVAAVHGPAVQAQTNAPGVRSLVVAPDEEKRSRIVDVVASVLIPDAMRPSPSAAQAAELRDQAVRVGKDMAIRRVTDDLGAAAGSAIKPIDTDQVFIVDVADMPAENGRFPVKMRVEVRFALSAAAAVATVPAAPPTTVITTARPIPGEMGVAARPIPGEMTATRPPGSDNATATVGGTGAATGAPVPIGSAVSGAAVGTITAAVGAATPLGSLATTGVPPSSSAPLTVQLRTDRQTYLEGENLVLYLNGNRDFYARVDYEDVTGKIIQILPNDIRKDGFFKASTEHAVPGPGDKFKLVVKPPFGNERVRLTASTAPLGSVPASPTGTGAAMVQLSQEEVSRRVRSLMVVPTDPAAAAIPQAGPNLPLASAVGGAGAEVYEAKWEITTMTR